MILDRALPRPPRSVRAAFGTSLTLLALAALPQAANAATTTLTVDSTTQTSSVAATEDATPGDGVCATAGGACTLYAAIQEANALPASPGDDIKIVFDDALGAATIETPNGSRRMTNADASADASTNAYFGNGFYYEIDAARPVDIDFGGDIAVESPDDANYGAFLVRSSGVTLQNFKNLRPGAAGIVVGADARNTVIRNGACEDESTIIAETCIGLVSEAADVTIEDVKSRSMWHSSVYFDVDQPGDDPIKNVLIKGLDSGGNSINDIHFRGTGGANVENVTIDDSDFDSPGAEAIRFGDSTVAKDVTIKNSRFVAADSYAIYTYGNVDTTNLKIEDSTFTGTSWAFVDTAGATHDGLTISGNRFEDTLQHVLDFVNATYENALVEDNDFVDARGNGLTTVWIGRAGTNNVVRGNRFTQAEGGSQNRWAIYNEADAPTASDSTGWTIDGNDVDGYRGNDYGPIANLGRGKTVTQRNTFGQRTSGTVTPLQSEAQFRWFVVNRFDVTNGRIQTWRPTSASADGTNVTITAAPVTPTLGGNGTPTTPVDIDVFWTADDNAEEYVGRITGAVAGTAYQLPTTHTTGQFRIQTLDAAGRSSQYSAPVQVGSDTTPPLAPEISGITPAGALEGLGEPAARVKVYDQHGALVAETTVNPDGSWSVPGPLPCGRTLKATQTDAAGNVSPLSGEATTPACPAAPAPTISEITPTSIVAPTGSGSPASCVAEISINGVFTAIPSTLEGGVCRATPPAGLAPGTYPVRIRVTDTDGQTGTVEGTLVVPAAIVPTGDGDAKPGVPQSEDEIRLQCGALPLALVDVKRGARNARTKRYGRTTIVGVADQRYVGQRVAIRFLATNKVVGRPKVGTDGRFRLTVADGDQRNRRAANARRYRAEIAGERSLALKLTRRIDTTSITQSGSTWRVRARTVRPFKAGARVRVQVLSSCGAKRWTTVKTSARVSAKGTVSLTIPAPAAGAFQIVRLQTQVPGTARKGARLVNTFTVPRGLR